MSDREQLEARAKELDLSFAPTIGDEKLKAKVDAEEARLKAATDAKAKPAQKAKAAPKRKAKADANEMDVYPVLDRVHHNGELYEVDDVIELTAAEHLELAAAGVVPLSNQE